MSLCEDEKSQQTLLLPSEAANIQTLHQRLLGHQDGHLQVQQEASSLRSSSSSKNQAGQVSLQSNRSFPMQQTVVQEEDHERLLLQEKLQVPQESDLQIYRVLLQEAAESGQV